MSVAEDLYDRDFYAWAMAQADVLRRRERGANALDYDNLVEEVEGLARAELRACESLLRRIVEHLLKIASANEGDMAVAHWRKEIATFRDQVRKELTPTLRRRLEADAQGVIEREIKTWKELDRDLAETARVDPPTLDECLAEDWFPEPGSRMLRRAPGEPSIKG